MYGAPLGDKGAPRSTGTLPEGQSVVNSVKRPDDVSAKLAALELGRSQVFDRLVEAAHQSGIGTLVLVGSLGWGGGDVWSDLDFIAVPGNWYSGLDLVGVFDGQVLASVKARRNAPIGGDYSGVCLEVSGLPLWIDWYLWPHYTAAIPTDGTAVFDCLGLSASELSFIPLIQGHSDPAASGHTDADAATLLGAAVAAKYLARNDLVRLAAKVPATRGLSTRQAAALLHTSLGDLRRPELAGAIAATRQLIDLAAAAAGAADPVKLD